MSGIYLSGSTFGMSNPYRPPSIVGNISFCSTRSNGVVLASDSQPFLISSVVSKLSKINASFDQSIRANKVFGHIDYEQNPHTFNQLLNADTNSLPVNIYLSDIATQDGQNWLLKQNTVILNFQTLSIPSGILIIPRELVLTNYGIINNNGIIINIGVINNETSGIVNNGTITNDGGTITNSGTINNGSLLNGINCTFINNVSGLINFNNITNYETITNNGTITTNTFYNYNSIVNSGQLLMNTFNNNGEIQNNGTIIIAVDNILTNAPGSTIINTFFIINYGTFINNAGNVNNNSGGTITNNGTLKNSGYFGGIINNGTFTNTGYIYNNSGGTITNNGIFTNSGTLNNPTIDEGCGIGILNGTVANGTSCPPV